MTVYRAKVSYDSEVKKHNFIVFDTEFKCEMYVEWKIKPSCMIDANKNYGLIYSPEEFYYWVSVNRDAEAYVFFDQQCPQNWSHEDA